MSTKYKKTKDVPLDVIINRLEELSNAITKGKESVSNEFTMRVPAERDRDADLVLWEAATRLEENKSTIDKLVEGLRNVAGFLLCDGQEVEDVFNPSKKEITEQINIIRDLINSVMEKK